VASIGANSQELSAQAENAPLCGGKRLKEIVAEGSADQPLVTLITAVFNGRSYLAKCLDSVLSQDYPNIEHIIIDGGSTDGTVDVLRQYDDRIALWRSEPDQGIYDAWNKALLEARGEWICFLGADDEFLPGAVSAYMALAAKNPQAEYLASKGRVVHPSGYEEIYGHPWTWKKFSRRMYALHVGSMHKTTLFQRYGQFDTSYRITGDYEFLLRPRAELRFAFMPMVTVLVRGGGISDCTQALHEANRAKLETGGLPRPLVLMDLSLALFKYKVRPLAHPILGGIRKIGTHVLKKNGLQRRGLQDSSDESLK
jgi:glycosyltransferase involved in cell wall biosynthesis